jgi:hypothetical protein
MNDQAVSAVMSPIVQYGFAGMSGVLLCIIVWQFKVLIGLLKENHAVITANTDTIRAVNERTREQSEMLHELQRSLDQRPCLRRGHDGGEG